MRHTAGLITGLLIAMVWSLGCGGDNLHSGEREPAPALNIQDEAQPGLGIGCRANARISQLPELLARHPELRFIDGGDRNEPGCLFYEERTQPSGGAGLGLTIAELCPDDWPYAMHLASDDDAQTRFGYGIACAKNARTLPLLERRLSQEIGPEMLVSRYMFEAGDMPMSLVFHGEAEMLAPAHGMSWALTTLPRWDAISALRIPPTIALREVGAGPDAPWLNLYEELAPLLHRGDHTLCDIPSCGFEPRDRCNPPTMRDRRFATSNGSFLTARLNLSPEGAQHEPMFSANTLTHHARLSQDEAGEACVKYETLAQGVYEVKVCMSHQSCDQSMRPLLGEIAEDDPRLSWVFLYNQHTRCTQGRFVRLGQDSLLPVGFDEGEDVGTPRQCVP